MNTLVHNLANKLCLKR